MTRRDFPLWPTALAALTLLTMTPALAQSPAAPPAATDPKPAAPKPIKLGEVLSGQLNAIRARGKKGKKAGATTFQLVSAPRRLPPPGDLCNLETGPETFQIVTASDAQAAQLKPLIGKQIELKVEAISCAEEAGVMSEAMVTKWSVIK